MVRDALLEAVRLALGERDQRVSERQQLHLGAVELHPRAAEVDHGGHHRAARRAGRVYPHRMTGPRTARATAAIAILVAAVAAAAAGGPPGAASFATRVSNPWFPLAPGTVAVFRVVSLHASSTTPYVSSRSALLTREWTPLEPGVLDEKLDVRGIGTVVERSVRGGDERLELVSLRRGSA
jgi:hypothetical protein